VDKIVRKTFADSEISLFRELQTGTADEEVEQRLLKAAIDSDVTRGLSQGNKT